MTEYFFLAMLIVLPNGESWVEIEKGIDGTIKQYPTQTECQMEAQRIYWNTQLGLGQYISQAGCGRVSNSPVSGRMRM